MSTPPSYGPQPGGGQYPGQAQNPYAGTPAQQQPYPYAAAPVGAPVGALQQAYPAPAYGQPQPGQQPYPNQQPTPGQQPPQGQQPFPSQPPQPSKASRFGKKLVLRLGVLVVLLVVAFAWAEFNGDPSTASVGDCIQNKGTDDNPDVHVISCSDPKAAYKVLKTASGSDDSVCQKVAGAVISFTETGSTDLVLCLGDNKPTG